MSSKERFNFDPVKTIPFTNPSVLPSPLERHWVPLIILCPDIEDQRSHQYRDGTKLKLLDPTSDFQLIVSNKSVTPRTPEVYRPRPEGPVLLRLVTTSVLSTHRTIPIGPRAQNRLVATHVSVEVT